MDIHIDNKLGQLPYEKIYVKRAPMTLLGDWLPTSPLARLPACTFWVIGCLCMLLAWLPTCNPTARAKLAGNTPGSAVSGLPAGLVRWSQPLAH
jgi:hypothetical protein